MIKYTILPIDVHVAATNLLGWQRDFAANSDDLPVLQSEERFNLFSQDYKVPSRGEPGTRAEKTKRFLDHMQGRLRTTDGDATRLACAWKDSSIFKQEQVSLASKLLAFRAPDRFVAMDQFSKIGVRRIDGGKAVKLYSDYLERVTQIKKGLWDDDLSGAAVRMPQIISESALKLRILDVALMRIGGRWNMPDMRCALPGAKGG